MTAKVILNPYSNRWNSQARWPEAEAALKAAGVDFELGVSERKGHITELVEQAVHAGFSPLIIAGGDGSIGDAVNGLARAAGSMDLPLGPLGIMPLGSANDLVDNLGIPKDLTAAAKVIAAGKIDLIDLGKCNDRYFANNSAAGLEPYVTTKQEKIHWIKGVPRYLVAAIQGIMDKPEWNVKVEWDDGSFEGPLSLISIGNGPRTGGIFFMSPHADPRDGKLTFAYGYRSTRLGLFQALPRAMKPGAGSFVEMEGMYEIHSTRLSIELDHPSPVHTDGELFPEYLRSLKYEIFSKRLQILLP
ncbi:MAG: diacylglycerol kinase family lipid kinase [Anaerolineaceae bacterium]|nr:MAG: diacylglycerol kinase family lipid kinase [Anaerolineaceae bacterium]